ncbi:unnamed protein product, partial [Adineta steineri]
VTLFWLLFHIHALFLTHNIEPAPNVIICSFQPGLYASFMNYYIILIQDILVPLSMIILGAWTVRNLRKRHQVNFATATTAVTAVTTAAVTARPTHSKNNQLIQILIIDISIYIIFSAMMPPALIYIQILQSRSSSLAEIQLGILLMNFALFSSYIPYCVGFYTNFIMSRKFRSEIKKIIWR